MRATDLACLLPEIVQGFNDNKESEHGPVFLALTSHLPRLHRCDDSLEQLVRWMIDQAISLSPTGHPVRLALTSRKNLGDVERLLNFHPPSWIQLKIATQMTDGFEAAAREMLQKLDFRHEDEWAAERPGYRLMAYSRGMESALAILFWIREHKASRIYILLIPTSDLSRLG